MYSKIIEGYKVSAQEALDIVENMPLNDLLSLANKLREYFLGKEFDTCSILNAKSGKCSENCKWCAQSAHNNTGCEVYGFVGTDKCVEIANESFDKKIKRFSLVTSGRTLSDKDLAKIAEAFKEMSKIEGLYLCGSFGLLNLEQFKVLKEAGMQRFHCNLETAPSYFDKLCTTHTIQEKIESIKAAQSVGMQICSGGIIGMGETMQQRVELALVLRDIKVDSIPINILQAIKNTPLENLKPLDKEEMLRTFAIFRIINPTVHIRFAGGRSAIKSEQELALKGGISGILMGDMLTTVGSVIDEDFDMLDRLEYEYR